MYGLIISTAIFLSLLLGEKLIRSKNLNENTYWGSALWAIIGGIVGARIYHVIDLWSYYEAEPIKILFLHQGGLGIYGAIIGGALSLYVYLKIKRESILSYFDVVAVLMALGQSIGRWGNYANMEILGKPTELPWGLYIPYYLRPEGYKFNDVYHPIYCYESLLNLILFVALLRVYLHRPRAGSSDSLFTKWTKSNGFYISAYLVGYGSIRLFLENLRIISWEFYGVNVAVLFSIVFIAIGLIGLGVLYPTPKKT